MDGSARRAFLRELIDDAGLFPPAQLSMRDALEENARSRASMHGWMLGRFIVASSALAELIRELGTPAEPLRLSVIVDGARAGEHIASSLSLARAAGATVAFEALEVRVPAVDEGDLHRTLDGIVAEIDASALPSRTLVYIETGFEGEWRTRLATAHDALAGARARSPHRICAKIRCGGVTADAAPTVDQLTEAIGSLRARGIPFKATAGLHHPLRHHDNPAGFTMHGFLNVIGAAVLDHAGYLDAKTRHRILVDHSARDFRLDDDAFAWTGNAADAVAVDVARRGFVHSFGSCSFREPVDDLTALGVLEPATA